MLEARRTDSCYCCVKRPEEKLVTNIDGALNELGMLSAVTQSRREYLKERQQASVARTSRGRYFSESGPVERSSDLAPPAVKTPPSSPNKRPYHIVQINKHFVSKLSTCLPIQANLDDLPSTSYDLGEHFSADTLHQKHKLKNLRSNSSASRLHRFRKPYEVPWHRNLQKMYSDYNPSPFQNVSSENVSPSQRTTSSNSATPEKREPIAKLSNLPRSRSLDEAEFSKLHLNELENERVALETKDVDSVSRHLNDLHVV